MKGFIKGFGIGFGLMAASLIFSCGAVLGANAVLDSDEEKQEEWRENCEKIPKAIWKATTQS